MATIDCATLDDVLRAPALKAVRDLTTRDPHLDEFLQQGILAFSDLAERETGRWFQTATYTEVLDADYGQRVLSLRAYPVTSVTSIKTASDGVFTTVTALDATSYGLVEAGRCGQIKLRAGWYPGWYDFGEGVQTVQVIYTGGLALTTDKLPADLRYACVEQVAAWFRRNPEIHLASQGQSGGSASYFTGLDLLPHVRRIVDGYRRMP